ncbi:MAG: MAPEG family protein [Methylotenera sp.]|uniref:MAPEG family protein n=1 Tax=Methylotenera sp. TaxID=2051956 RepID=UPI00248A81BD|nr:MAPEG family protein [Methylotenera sp.]MDI1308866.1 MAPEG family protein [Methylotenera sp.]
MAVELICLVWSVLLGLAHILIAGQARTNELGAKWNVGARDGVQPKLSAMTNRLFRAQANFFETFPLFAAVILITATTQLYSTYSQWGAILYLAARVVYFPLYAFGIPVIRSIVWLISLFGILLVLFPLVF